MIRLILLEVDCQDAAGAGAPVHHRWKTFDLEAPELERWLSEKPNAYVTRSLEGAERIEADMEVGNV